jgi:hypothetical protein
VTRARTSAARLAALALAAGAAGCGGSAGGGGQDEPQARATVGRYFSALGAGDARGACAQMTTESRDKLAELGGAMLHLRTHSCAATIRRVLASPGGPRLRELSRSARVTRLEHEGAGVHVRVSRVGTPLEVVRAQGGWRIRSEPALEPDAR